MHRREQLVQRFRQYRRLADFPQNGLNFATASQFIILAFQQLLGQIQVLYRFFQQLGTLPDAFFQLRVQRQQRFFPIAVFSLKVKIIG